MEITAQQLSILERLQACNFQIVAFPAFETYVGVRKGNCAALLAPQQAGGFTLYGRPSYLVSGRFSAKIFVGDEQYFVSKSEKLPVTAERAAELSAFSSELAESLLPTA